MLRRCLLISLILLLAATGLVSTQDNPEQGCGKTLHAFGTDNRIKSPWTALIFVKINGKYVSWAGGVIVSSSTVITRGGPFWQHSGSTNGTFGAITNPLTLSSSPRMIDLQPNNFVVGVGIGNRKVIEPDENTQLLKVDYIRPHPKSFQEHTVHDFAIIKLKSDIKFSWIVSPICVEEAASSTFTAPTLNTEFLRGPKRFSGYRYFPNYDVASRSHTLKEGDICEESCQLTALKPALHQLASDELAPCAQGRNKEETENILLVGSSLATWIGVRWHLVGIVTNAYECDLAFTHKFSLIPIKDNLVWINSNMKNGRGTYSCLSGEAIRSSAICNGEIDCKYDGGSDEETSFCATWKQCFSGGGVRWQGGCDSTSDLELNVTNGAIVERKRGDVSGGSASGTTQRPSNSGTGVQLVRPPSSSAAAAKPGNVGKTCPPPIPEHGIQHICFGANKRKPLNCSQPAQPGWTIKLSCANHFKSASGVSAAQKLCQRDGSWKQNRHFECSVECGVPKVPLIGLIINGTAANTSHWPWNAGLWKRTTSGPKYICGATLITEDVVLTAAHCLIDRDGGEIKLANFRVILSPVSSSYRANRLNQHTQIAVLKSIFIHENYNPGSFESDVGIIKLGVKAQISDYIYPACFPFPGRENSQIERYQTSAGSTGIVIGFGVDESNQISPILRQATLPVISPRDCVKVLDILPSSSQICAGYTTGRSVCNGDSGGGLFFQEEGARQLYFIQGIVSHGKLTDDTHRCDSRKYSIFTKAASFNTWVESIVYDI